MFNLDNDFDKFFERTYPPNPHNPNRYDYWWRAPAFITSAKRYSMFKQEQEKEQKNVFQEVDGGYKLSLDAPGITELSAMIENDTLTLTGSGGERKLSLQISLPDDIVEASGKVTLEYGVITVTFDRTDSLEADNMWVLPVEIK